MTPITNIKIVRLGRQHGGLVATADKGQYLYKKGYPSQVIVQDPVLAAGKQLQVEMSYAISADGMPTTNNMVPDHINGSLAIFLEVVPR